MFAHDFGLLRANHYHTLRPFPAKLNSFNYSFFVNIVNEWNHLPKDVAEAETLNIFKKTQMPFYSCFRKF